MYDFINKAKNAFEVDVSFVKIDDYDFLYQNQIPYLIPWIPPTGKNYGSARVNNQKAVKHGLTFRDITQTISDTYQWWYSSAVTDESRRKFETDPKSLLIREKSVIKKWKEQFK